MSAALAEQPHVEFCRPNLRIVSDDFRDDWPQAIFVPDLITEQFDCAHADRLIHNAGAVALAGVNLEEEKTEKQTFTSLYNAIPAAKEGNQTARKLVKMNLSTDKYERTNKVQSVNSIELEQDERGEIIQHGQTNEQIQANTLYYHANNPKMLPRFHSETRNKFRLGTALRKDMLNENWFLVASLCADDMIDDELEDEGFFHYTKSLAFQGTTVVNGKIVMQSAFVAGVKQEGEERHDFVTLKKMGEVLKVDLTGSAAEIIDKPILVPKSMMPNGIIDIVKLFDDLAGGTFFGEDKPRQDYERFLQTCMSEQEEAEHQIDEMTDILLARSHEAIDPVSASLLLSDVVGKYMAEASVEDDRIDPRVFGTKAAWYITDARAHLAMGDFERAKLMTNRAVEVERSSSCPGGAKRLSEALDGTDGITNNDVTSVIKEEGSADCDFVSKECPLCHTKNVKTTVKNGEYIGACGCSSRTGKHHKKTQEPKEEAKVVLLFSDSRKKLGKIAA